jgi:RimJ/RimL family protein N-acetyltransferase
MAKAILTVGFEHLGLSTVVAFTLPTNRASRRVMEQVGCTFERNIVHAGLPHVLYRIKAAARRD